MSRGAVPGRPARGRDCWRAGRVISGGCGQDAGTIDEVVAWTVERAGALGGTASFVYIIRGEGIVDRTTGARAERVLKVGEGTASPTGSRLRDYRNVLGHTSVYRRLLADHGGSEAAVLADLRAGPPGAVAARISALHPPATGRVDHNTIRAWIDALAGRHAN